MIKNIRLNVKPILGSIAVALVLWFMVTTDRTYSYQISVPIDLVRLAESKTLMAPIPDHALNEVQGSGRSLIAAWFYEVAFRLELPEVRKSTTLILKDHLNLLDLPSTFGIEVLEIIEPKEIEIKIDDMVIKRIAVSLAGIVEPEDGYTLSGYNFSMDSIIVSGPKAKLDNLSTIATRPVEHYDNKFSFSEKVELINPEPGIVEIEPGVVEINYDIQRLVERIVYNIPIRIKNIPANLIVAAVPPELALKVKGGERIIADLGPEDINAEIDYLHNYQPDREQYAASISTPDDISWIESIPKTFTLQVRRK